MLQEDVIALQLWNRVEFVARALPRFRERHRLMLPEALELVQVLLHLLALPARARVVD